ncbi:hypothetical protein [Lentzea sp. E54]|uniref:hypothetical protein n=1 Tax=Lentzea xerophila TaxID=3435883 RepID=UPI003DA36D8B
MPPAVLCPVCSEELAVSDFEHDRVDVRLITTAYTTDRRRFYISTPAGGWYPLTGFQVATLHAPRIDLSIAQTAFADPRPMPELLNHIVLTTRAYNEALGHDDTLTASPTAATLLPGRFAQLMSATSVAITTALGVINAVEELLASHGDPEHRRAVLEVVNLCDGLTRADEHTVTGTSLLVNATPCIELGGRWLTDRVTGAGDGAWHRLSTRIASLDTALSDAWEQAQMTSHNWSPGEARASGAMLLGLLGEAARLQAELTGWQSWATVVRGELGRLELQVEKAQIALGLREAPSAAFT